MRLNMISRRGDNILYLSQAHIRGIILSAAAAFVFWADADKLCTCVCVHMYKIHHYES